VYTALWKIDKELREKVEEITLDLSSSMKTIAIMAFPKATKVIDRFHVQKLALDAVQELRIKFRWDAMDRENAMKKEAKAKGEDFKPEIFSNGDTEKQLLIRSRYLLFKARKFWTKSQQKRAQILFNRYPDLETAYNLADGLRTIYSTSKTKGGALLKLAKWYKAVDESGFESFKTISETIQTSYERVLNFFENRSTNASAESFNAKIKAFRAQLRGIRDVKYFLFRLKNIYA
jgi:transposase